MTKSPIYIHTHTPLKVPTIFTTRVKQFAQRKKEFTVMGRQGGSDPTMVSSSIALLQERFRKLQKVREKREGKELLKLFSESNFVSLTTVNYEPNRLSFRQTQPELVILPYKQPPVDDFRALTVPAAASTSLWPNSAASSSTSTSSENSDVDTSLHL